MFEVVNFASSTKQVRNVVSQLNDKQKEAVKEIGFGSMLGIKINEIDRRLYFKILSQYDSKVITLHDKTVIHANNYFYHEVLGLPFKEDISGQEKGKEVLETNMEKEEVERVKQEWRKAFGIENKENNYVSQDTLTKKVLAEKDGGDSFKKLFVMFAISSFLAPTTNKELVLDIAPALEDASEIVNYDWCTYIANVVDENARRVRGLVKERERIKMFGTEEQKKKVLEKEFDKNGKRRLLMKAGGCFPALMIGYMHQHVFDQLPSERKPYILNWDDKLIKKRIDKQVGSQNVGTAKASVPQVAIKATDQQQNYEQVTLVNSKDVSLCLYFV